MKLTKTLGAGITMALLMGLALPMAAQAEQPSEVLVNLDQPTKAEFNPYNVEIPRLHLEDAMANENVRVRYVNTSDKHAVFTAPEFEIQGISYLVPANTTREFLYPRSAVGYETRQVSYNVERIPDPVPPGPQFEDWKNRLAALIAAQRPDYSYFPQYQFNK